MSLLLLFPSAGGALTLSLPAGSLTVSGLSPALSEQDVVAVPAGTLTLAGLAPSIGQAVIVIPAGAITLAGWAPTIGGIQLTINGVTTTMLHGWDIHAQANGRAVMRLQVRSMDATYRPALDQEVVFTDSGAVVFGGLIEGLSESGIGETGGTPIVTTILARDYNTLPTRRYVTTTIPPGTLKSALQALVTYIPGSVTLDPAQVDGPTLPEVVLSDLTGDEALNYLSTLTGYIWEITTTKKLRMYAPGTFAAPFNLTVPNSKAVGDVIVEPTRQDYANRVIVRNDTVRKQADDAAEQAARGLWELLVSAPDETTETVAQNLADAILARSTPTLKKVRYRTRESGVQPGQTQTITLPTRNVNNTFLITDMVVRADGVDRMLREVTAIEGLVYQTGWRETYKRWNGSSLPLAGAIYGSSALRRFAYFLGGSGVEAVRSSGPTWVPVSGGATPGTGSVQVQVNTVARGTTAATVTVRLRAQNAGVSVKARLYDVTDAVACAGESALVISTAWQTVTFTATLTSGSHFYELELLCGAANEPCFGVGYLE